MFSGGEQKYWHPKKLTAHISDQLKLEANLLTYLLTNILTMQDTIHYTNTCTPKLDQQDHSRATMNG